MLTCGCSLKDDFSDKYIYTTLYPIEYATTNLYGDYGNVSRVYPNGSDASYEITENNPEIHSMWIARNKDDVNYLSSLGYEAYFRFSLKGIYHGLTAKVHIFNVNDTNRHLSEGAFLVNLWHGVGLKKIKWLTPRNYVRQFGLKSEKEMESSWLFKIKSYIPVKRLHDPVEGGVIAMWERD